ncbi:hypothetical protein [Sphingobium sp. B11D3A]|uniref:pPIWI-associating nuclease domain-containing protein n=1 Tax=Sphingobium sp. B11D3A TaxID=2940574 RepID=UPI0022241A1F|nr:hypothetical protein [Sphingobium sp. B11D3A]MCW2393557.1 hypothetical protein [Sphingobium sp. B11D3A]
MADKVPSWRDIGKASRALSALFPGDRFLKTVLRGCIKVGKQKSNPIRGNFLATGLREAVNHIIHKLAPDDEVRGCVWFVQAEDTDTVTRKQRATYIIKGGLPDEFLREELKIEVAPDAKALADMINGLNRSTHVRPNTILTEGTAVRRLFYDVLDAVDTLLDAAEDSRSAVRDAVATALHNRVFERLISETIQELDELSTHTTVDHHWIDAIEVKDINSETIRYEVAGTVSVALQYGSNSDVRGDIGFRASDSYPYEATVICSVADPLGVDPGDIELKVDNSSFFE